MREGGQAGARGLCVSVLLAIFFPPAVSLSVLMELDLGLKAFQLVTEGRRVCVSLLLGLLVLVMCVKFAVHVFPN